MRSVIARLGLLWGTLTPMFGAVQTYDSRVTWVAAITNETDINFQGLVPDGQYAPIMSPPGYTFSNGVNFDLINHTGTLFILGNGVYYSDESVISSQGESGSNPQTLRITFPATTAVGLDYGQINVMATFTFTLSTGEVFTTTVPPTLSFFGVTTDTPITSIDITMLPSGYALNVAQFSMGTAQATAPSCTASTSNPPTIVSPTATDQVASITVTCNFDMTTLPAFALGIYGFTSPYVSSQASDNFSDQFGDGAALLIQPTVSSVSTNSVTVSNIVINDQGKSGAPGSPLVTALVVWSSAECGESGPCEVSLTPTPLVLATFGSSTQSCTASASNPQLVISSPTSMDPVSPIALMCNFNLDPSGSPYYINILFPNNVVQLPTATGGFSAAGNPLPTQEITLVPAPQPSSQPVQTIVISNLVLDDSQYVGVTATTQINAQIQIVQAPTLEVAHSTSADSTRATTSSVVASTTVTVATIQPQTGVIIAAPTSLPNGTVGVVYPPVTFTASGGTGNFSWFATNLPTGLSMSLAGVLSGTPGNGTQGRYTVTVTVSDFGNNTTASNSLLLTINPSSLAIPSPTVLATGTEGVAYALVTFMATGGAGGYIWSATGLPVGLAISQAGVLSGTPASGTAGNYTVNVIVTDANNVSTSVTYPLTINPAPGGGITLSARSLSFAFIQGGAVPSPQSFGVLGSGGAVNYRVAVATSSGGNWLVASPATGQTPGNVIVSAQNLTSLIPSTTPYQGTATIQPQDSSIPAQVVTVSLLVTGGEPQLSLSATDLRYQVTAGSPGVEAFIRVLNTGGGSLNYSIEGAASWLTITCGAQGTATSSSPGLICLQLNPVGLTADTYSETLTVTGAGQQLSVSVTLQVSSVATSILLSATAMTFTSIAGSSDASPASQTVSVLNGGQGTMNWTAQISGSNSWLTISPESGSSLQFGSSQPGITFTPNPAGLAKGDYYALINVTVPNGSASNSPAAIVVFLRVLPAGNQLPPAVSTAGLIFTAQAGGTVTASKPLTLMNGAGSDVNFSCLLFTAPGGNGATQQIQAWVSGPPAAGAVPASGSFPMLVQADPSALPAGTYYSQLRLGFSNNTQENVDVTFLVTPASSTQTAENTSAARPKDSGSCSQYGLTFDQQVPTDGGTVVAGQPYVLQLQSLCVPSPPSALNVEIDFSAGNGGPLYPAYDSTSGTYQATWTPSNTGNVQFYAQSNPVNAVGLPAGATQTQPFSVTVTAPDPNGSAIPSAVKNAASFVTSNQVAAGSFISIFGQQFASETIRVTNPPFPTTLAGIQITLAGTSLPLYFANTGQINAIVPFLKDQSLNTALPLVVRRGATTAPPLSLNLVQFQPGIFSTNSRGFGQGAIQNAKYQIVDSGHQAKAGDTIIIYGAGLGPVTNPPASGAVAHSGSLTTSKPTVYIDGIPATVSYSGLTPGAVQLYQVNAVVPKGIHSGVINVYLTIAGVQSNTVTIN